MLYAEGRFPRRWFRNIAKRAREWARGTRTRKHPKGISDDVAGTYEVGAPGFEPGTSCSQSRRATELRHAPSCRYHNNLAPVCNLAKTGGV